MKGVVIIYYILGTIKYNIKIGIIMSIVNFNEKFSVLHIIQT